MQVIVQWQRVEKPNRGNIMQINVCGFKLHKLCQSVAMIQRTIESVLRQRAASYPVVTITGPRQSGKTTLCRKVFPEYGYVNLEAPDMRSYATDDPQGFLAAYQDGVILDEIQRVPSLLSYIQTIVDEKKSPGQYILTGSQQFEVMNTISQSLAGRTALLKLLPLSLTELSSLSPPANVDSAILCGFYPRIHDQKLNPTHVMGDYSRPMEKEMCAN
jgi:predicted AAA+ superfamily ATPase